MRNCIKCVTQCLQDDHVICGICNSKTHLKCANILAPDLVLLKNNKNIMFTCDNCAVSFSRSKVDKAFKNISALDKFIKIFNCSDSEVEDNKSVALAADNVSNTMFTRSKAKVTEPKIVKMQSSNQRLTMPLHTNNAEIANMQSVTLVDLPADKSVSLVGGPNNGSTTNNSAPNAVVVDSNNVVVNACAVNATPSSSIAPSNYAAAAACAVYSVAASNATCPSPASHDIRMLSADNAPSDSNISIGAAKVNSGQWATVMKRQKQNKQILVVGTNANADLDVSIRSKWLHLSSFANSVTEDNILDYVVNHAGVPKNSLMCHKLVKKDTPISTLKRVNFKLGVPETLYEKLLNSDICRKSSCIYKQAVK